MALVQEPAERDADLRSAKAFVTGQPSVMRSLKLAV